MTAWSRGLVLCSGDYFDRAKKMHEHHLVSALAEHLPVLFVDPPTSHLTARRDPELAAALRRPRLRRVNDRVAHLTPVALPKPHARANVALTSWLARRAIRRAVAELGMEPQALISSWPLLDVFDACPRARHVYWWTDDPADAAGFWGFDGDRLVAGDHALRARADLVLAVSQEVVAEVGAAGGRAQFFPNGCDAATMLRTGVDPVAEDVTLPAPIVGFVGHINARTDLSLLEAVAGTGLSLLIIGPHVAEFEPERFAALCRRDNVQWVGLQPFDRLPAYQGLMQVGLVPYADTRFNRSSFPLKPLEYLAAGRPVVSTGLPGIRWLGSPDVTFADEPADFARAAVAAAALPLEPGLIARRRDFAAGHTWAHRAIQLLDALGEPATAGAS